MKIIEDKEVKTKPGKMKSGTGEQIANQKGPARFLELDLEPLSLLVAKLHSIFISESLRSITSVWSL